MKLLFDISLLIYSKKDGPFAFSYKTTINLILVNKCGFYAF